MKNDLTGADLKVKMNSYFNFADFYEYLLYKPDLSQKTGSLEKYSYISEVLRRTK